ncbi:MAG: helix-turn-helix domain-containing protein [Stellaceae bacterium]
MPRLVGHGKAKYITGTRLDSSRERGWRGLLAERWHHSEGDLGEVLPRDTEVIVMLSGQLRVRRRGDGQMQQHDAVPGTVWLCPAGVREDMIHLYGEIPDSVHLYLPASALAKTALQELDVDPQRLRLRYAGGFRDPLIEAIGRTVAAELSNPSPVAALLVDTLAAALGVYVMRSYSSLLPASHTPPPARGALDGRRLARVLAFIDAKLDRDLTLEELAREACLSPFHFARSFKAAVGASPHRFLLQRRLDHAKALLRAGAPSMTEVALSCGFSSPAHFASSFKRATGVTPSHFRRL